VQEELKERRMRTIGQGGRPEPQPLTLTIPQAAELLGISASKAYEAARAGDLPTIKIGARVLVSRRRLEELIDGPSVAQHSRLNYDRASGNPLDQLESEERKSNA
jgi:excisionase family DNA binding protein